MTPITIGVVLIDSLWGAKIWYDYLKKRQLSVFNKVVGVSVIASLSIQAYDHIYPFFLSIYTPQQLINLGLFTLLSTPVVGFVVLNRERLVLPTAKLPLRGFVIGYFLIFLNFVLEELQVYSQVAAISYVVGAVILLWFLLKILDIDVPEPTESEEP